MGLLDGLFGGNTAGAGASGGGAAMIEQLVVAALSNQGGGQGGVQPGAQGTTQGGGMLGSLLSGLGGAGGLQGLMSAFQQNGMGHIAESWAGNGPNQPVSPDQVQTAFGDDKVQSIADQTGMPKQDVLSHLAQMLPGIVDRMTQNGRVT